MPTTGDKITVHVISMKRDQTGGSGSPMWRCTTLEGINFNIFQHEQAFKNSYRYFRPYHPEMSNMVIDDVLRWTAYPIEAELVYDGKYYNPSSDVTRPEGAEPEMHYTVDLMPWKRAAIRWARMMQAPPVPVMLLDSETTGTGITAEIVELAIKGYDNQQIFHRYIMPRYPERLLLKGKSGLSASDINHITPEMLTEADAQPFSEYYNQIDNLIRGRILVGYNISFDLDRIDGECIRAGLSPLLPAGVHDAMKYVRWMYADYDTMKADFAPLSLQEACYRAQIMEVQSHGAMDDCSLLQHLIDKIAESELYIWRPGDA